MSDSDPWTLSASGFDPDKLHHRETIFTIGNGYLSTRGAFEEGFPGDRRATFLHGVFDAAPVAFTELANTPDWLPLVVLLNGERFSLAAGQVEDFEQHLDLRSGVLTRTVAWRSPGGLSARLVFERFASLADQHTLYIRCQVTPDFEGQVEFRAGLHGCTDNEGLVHWNWLEQGQDEDGAVYLLNATRESKIQLATAMRLEDRTGEKTFEDIWNVENAPTCVLRLAAQPGRAVEVVKTVAVATSRDTPKVIRKALSHLRAAPGWVQACEANSLAWQVEWERSDVVVEGDEEAQIALRFNIYHMLIAAPRHDDRVSIGAKTLSGYGYRGHSFWDTEIFMLPLFTFTAPHIARNLLNYRYHTLPAAREKARRNGFEGAQFAWESADTGEEVTPTWLQHFSDPTRLVRIWTGDIEIHISADIAYAAVQYWQVTGDDGWMVEKGAELVLDTARFWAARAEWNAQAGRYEYTDVIGPDEYHDHVDNNYYTNRMAVWNLETAFRVLAWLAENYPEKSAELTAWLDLTERRLAHWQDVIEKMYLPGDPSGLMEQFAGYFDRRPVDLAALEPRLISAQVLFGIEGANETQVLKQPDVLMLLYLLRSHFNAETVRVNYDYYTPRTDHTYGSSLGPAIQAIMACEVDRPDEAYEHFIRAARADLRDVRGNASDGIHAASAGGTWMAAVFGFGGLRVTADGWQAEPRLPSHWKRLAFRFIYRGEQQKVDLMREA